MRVRFRFAAAPLYAACLLAGCGGGGGGGTPATSVPPAPTTAPGAAASATFLLGALPAAAKSAAVIFPTGSLIAAPFSAGCPASPSCSITVPGPTGKSVSSYRVYVYPTANGSGTALLIATGDIDLAPGKSNVATVVFHHVINSYVLTLAPATLTAQMTTSIDVGVVAKDVAGATLTYPYFASDGGQPVFEVTATESNGTTQSATGGTYATPSDGILTTYYYQGVAPYPVKFTANLFAIPATGPPLPGYAPVSATLAVHQPANPVGYALSPSGLNLYAGGTTTLARSYVLGYGHAEFVRFDPSGNAWVQNVQGAYPSDSNADAYTLDGVSSQGAATASISMPLGDSLLSFDAAGRLYLANAGTIAGRISVAVFTVGAGSKLALVRTVVLPAAPCSGAADATGRLYVATCATSGVTQYAPGSNTASAANPTAGGPVTVDSAGNLYAMYGTAIGEWTAGTFGPAAPARTLAGLPCPLADLAVDVAGDVYALTGPSCAAGNSLFYYTAGATAPTLLQIFSNAYDANYTGQHSVAVPLK